MLEGTLTTDLGLITENCVLTMIAMLPCCVSVRHEELSFSKVRGVQHAWLRQPQNTRSLQLLNRGHLPMLCFFARADGGKE